MCGLKWLGIWEEKTGLQPDGQPTHSLRWLTQTVEILHRLHHLPPGPLRAVPRQYACPAAQLPSGAIGLLRGLLASSTGDLVDLSEPLRRPPLWSCRALIYDATGFTPHSYSNLIRPALPTDRLKKKSFDLKNGSWKIIETCDLIIYKLRARLLDGSSNSSSLKLQNF